MLVLRGGREHCRIQGWPSALHHLYDCLRRHPQRRRNTGIVFFSERWLLQEVDLWVSIISFEICIHVVYTWLSQREHLSQLLWATWPWLQIHRMNDFSFRSENEVCRNSYFKKAHQIKSCAIRIFSTCACSFLMHFLRKTHGSRDLPFVKTTIHFAYFQLITFILRVHVCRKNPLQFHIESQLNRFVLWPSETCGWSSKARVLWVACRFQMEFCDNLLRGNALL